MGQQASGVNAERAFHRPSCRIPWAQAAPCLATQRAEGADPIQRVSAVPRASRPAGSPTKAEEPPANRSPQLCGRGGCLGLLGAAGARSLCRSLALSLPCAHAGRPRPQPDAAQSIYFPSHPAPLRWARRNYGFDGRSPCYQQPKHLNQANLKCIDSFALCKA